MSVFYLDFSPDQLAAWKRRILQVLEREDPGIYLDSNSQAGQAYQRYELLAAGGLRRRIEYRQAEGASNPFSALQRWRQESGGWAFGYFAYDLKNDIEALGSRHPDLAGFADLYFFEPAWVISIAQGASRICIEGPWAKDIWQALQTETANAGYTPRAPIQLAPQMSYEAYIQRVEQIRELIRAGDLYEMNLCRALCAESVHIDPFDLFAQLNAAARVPFAAFLRIARRYLLCASPERFLYKEGDLLVSQPIKGTRPRLADPQADQAQADELRQSEKDRAENVMIVDLVRNDLAKVCHPGSVGVNELFGIYSFASVHQMISTVSGRLRSEVDPVEAVKAAFPMGSMTGAPKVRAMQRIEQLELNRRGMYSGAVGYFDPAGNFDFNVVIRSLLYDAESGNLSCQVGGAIVYDSDPQSEWEETEWKLRGIRQILANPPGAVPPA